MHKLSPDGLSALFPDVRSNWAWRLMARLRPNICQTSNRSPDAAIDHRNWFEHMGRIIITDSCPGILMLSHFNASNIRILFELLTEWLHDWNIIFHCQKLWGIVCGIYYCADWLPWPCQWRAILCSLMNSDILVLSILIFTILTRACSDGRRWRLLYGSVQLPSE